MKGHSSNPISIDSGPDPQTVSTCVDFIKLNRLSTPLFHSDEDTHLPLVCLRIASILKRHFVSIH